MNSGAQSWQVQKAESLGRMAGAIAHHLNNQLTAVMGSLELAMADAGDRRAALPLNDALLAARRAADVSRSLLTYLGQTRSTHTPLDLTLACIQTLPVLRSGTPRRVVLETDLPIPGPSIDADADQIRQVLVHLVTNAWESVGAGTGTVRLSVGTTAPSAIPAVGRFPEGWWPRAQPHACLTVKDSGAGIAEGYMEFIFDPFFSTKLAGRGLGLSVVMGIVRAHGGGMTVASAPGRGSDFSVYIPLSAQSALRTDDADPAGQPDAATGDVVLDGDGTVLVVEDEDVVRRVTASMLMRLGYTVLVARNGGEAVELFRQRCSDIRCVLCDLAMPEMDGWATLTALRTIRPGLPVVLASGYDEARSMSGDHPERPQAFLSKPYELRTLHDVLARAVATRVRPSPAPTP